MPTLTLEQRERLTIALRFATSTMFVSTDDLEQREEVKALAAGHGYTVLEGAWTHVARALVNEDVTKYAHVLDAPFAPATREEVWLSALRNKYRVRDTEAAARFAANHPHPALLIASSVHAPELRRSNAWDRRAFTLDLTSAS